MEAAQVQQWHAIGCCLKVYEIQCNAIKEEVEKGVVRAKRIGAQLVWVAENMEILETA